MGGGVTRRMHLSYHIKSTLRYGERRKCRVLFNLSSADEDDETITRLRLFRLISHEIGRIWEEVSGGCGKRTGWRMLLSTCRIA